MPKTKPLAHFQKLVVRTDRVKLQRIAQNLINNALKYTTSSPERSGIVSVSWSTEGEFRWVLSVQDSGPGLPTSIAGALAVQLRPTVEPTAVMGPDQSEPVAVLPDDVPTIPMGQELTQLNSQSPKGEGVGLQIVKRLCELLDANLDVETKPGIGYPC
ncbi:MAG: ATP-binding protein, partial [Cytophagaceae bacterium]